MAGPGPGTPGRGQAGMADAIVPPGSSAILVGVSAYEYAELPPIRAARNSLQAMRSMLTDPELCGWPRGQLRVIANPLSAEELSAEIAEVAAATTGVLLLYYVGHGVLSADGELCLSVTATHPDRPEASGLPWRALADTLRGSPAHTRLSILDCCFGGQATAAGPESLAPIEGGYTLAATGRDEPAAVPQQDGRDAACTSFTAELRDLVAAGLPSRAPWLTFGDLYPALRERLLAQDLPAPSEQGSGAAREFAFTANAALPGRPRRTAAVATLGVQAAVTPETRATPAPPTAPTPPAAPATPAPRATPEPAAAPAPSAAVPVAPDRAQVDHLVIEALRAAQSVPESPPKAQALISVATAVRPGDPDRAVRLVADAHRVAQSIREAEPRALALAGVTGPLAISNAQTAESVAQSLPGESWKASALAGVAATVAAGDTKQAGRLIADAERDARSAGRPDQQATALAAVSAALAVIDPDHGEEVAHSISAPDQKASALASLAEAVIGTDPDRAGRLIADAERLARPLPGASARAPALASVGRVLARLDAPRASRLIADAERSAQSIPGTDRKASALAAVAGALAAVDPSHAEKLARSITSIAWQAAALAGVAAALATAPAGDPAGTAPGLDGSVRRVGA
jgi:Caspase domain